MTDSLKYVQVGDLCRDITENILPDSDELSGKTMHLHFEDGNTTRFRFKTGDDLTWEIIAGPDKGSSNSETYRATCPREGVYFVDYIKQNQRATTVSLVIDTVAKAATSVIGTLPTEADTRKDAFTRVLEDIELTGVDVQFLKATIDTAYTAQDHPHVPTDELVNKRIQYIYSQTEVYEHIYLNENLYTWHCLKGIEKVWQIRIVVTFVR